MASTLQHLTIAIKINESKLRYKNEELIQYLLGSIVCDAPKLQINDRPKDFLVNQTPNEIERKSSRAHTHYLRPSTNANKKEIFISEEVASKYGYRPVDDSANSKVDYIQFCPMIKYFINKYFKYLNEPFMIGYLVHLITDDIYFDKITPLIINENLNSITSFINEEYNVYGYQKKEYLSNGEYLAWTHHFLYGDYAKYNNILIPEYEKNIPDFYSLSRYLRNWEESNKPFKPSMIKDLNDTESLIYFIENANNLAKNIRLIKQNLKYSNVPKNIELDYFALNYYKKLEEETEKTFNDIYSNLDRYKI
ncbi:MAG: hypothetical protein ACI4U4_04060 [Bacilli bacterium]